MTVYHVGDTVRVTKLLVKDKKANEGLVLGGTYTVNRTFVHGSVYVSVGRVAEYPLSSDQVERVEQKVTTTTTATATATATATTQKSKRAKKVFESDTWLVKYNEAEDSLTIDLMRGGKKIGQVYVDETVFRELEEAGE